MLFFSPDNHSCKWWSKEVLFVYVDACLLFAVRVTEHWHTLTKEVVESPSFDILKSHLDMVLGNLFYVALLEQGG